jgi:hypothetical protein
MHEAFAVHRLTEDGMKKAAIIAEAFDELLSKLVTHCSDGREMSLVRTKLEEASFFAKKAMAKTNAT